MSDKELTLRDKILDISRELLFKEGYSALTMRRIANMAGVSATSIYLYFENKDHLLHTLIDESVEDLSVAIEKGTAGKTNTLDLFDAIIKNYVDFAFSNPEKYQIIYMVQPDAMARYPKEKFRKARRCYELLVKVIEKGVNEGIMEVDNPVIAAYSIWAQLHGVVSVVLNQRLDSRIERNQFINESMELIVQGFLIKTSIT